MIRHARRTLTLVLAALLALVPGLFPGSGTGRVARAAGCVVTTLADSGDGSLRAQLADSGCDAITFQAGLAGTITLASDLPTITRAVSVTGPGAASLTVNRNDTNHGYAFPIGAGGNLTLTGLTVTGAVWGVSLTAGGMVTVIGGILSGNGAGLVIDGGSVTATNSILSNNYDGLYFSGSGSANVVNSTLDDNINAGLNFYQGGNATVTGSTLSSNLGGVMFTEGGSATVTNSTLSSNTYGFFSTRLLAVVAARRSPTARSATTTAL